MKKIIFFLVSITILFSCQQPDKWYKTKTGLLYKVIPSGSTDPVRMGMTVKLNYTQKVGDSVMETTYDKMPLYYMVVPGMSYYNPLEVFDYLQMGGDSIITKQLVDSMITKKIFTKMPSWMKINDEWITNLKIEKVFHSDSAVQADKLSELKRVAELQRKLGEQRVEEFIQRNHINAKKNDSGVYTEIIHPGMGAVADPGKYISIRYKITNLKGKVCDTNMDTAFHHPDTLRYVLQSGFMLRSVDVAINGFKKDSHARIYVPTMLAFGGSPPQGSLFRPYDDMIVEIYLLDVADKKMDAAKKKQLHR